MDEHTAVAGGTVSSLTSPRSEITHSPCDIDEKLRSYVFERTLGWIVCIENGGVKKEPPLEIILVPELMEKAWYPNRLVPWIYGFVPWEIYLEYLDTFLKLNGPLIDLDLAMDQCYELEETAARCASGLSEEEMSLSRRIMSQIEEIRKKTDCMSKEESCLAAAGLMCITAEAKIMISGLTRDYLGNAIRRRALDLMVNKGPGCAAVYASLLGLATEAKLMLGFLKQDIEDNPYLHSEIRTCWTVRTRTLTFLTNLQMSYALDTAGNRDWDVASYAKKSTRKPMGVDKSDTNQDNTAVPSAKKENDDLKDDVSGGDKHLGKKTGESKNMNKKRKIKLVEKKVEVPVSAINEVRKDATKIDTDDVTSVNMHESKGLAHTTEDATGGGAQDSEEKSVPMDTDAKAETSKKKRKNESEKAVEEDYEMSLKDGVMEEAKEKKNAVQLYETYGDLVTSEDRLTLLHKLLEVEEWLDKDGKDATKEVYVAKLEELKKVGGAIEARYKEWDGGSSLEQLVCCIRNCKEAALSSDPKFDHIDISDKQEVVCECRAVESWLIALLKHTTPSDFRKKAEELDRFCKTIMKAKASTGAADPTGAKASEPAYEGRCSGTACSRANELT